MLFSFWSQLFSEKKIIANLRTVEPHSNLPELQMLPQIHRVLAAADSTSRETIRSPAS